MLKFGFTELIYYKNFGEWKARPVDNTRGLDLVYPCARISLIFTVAKFGQRAMGPVMGLHFILSFP